MQTILETLRKSLNEEHRLSGLTTWMNRFEKKLKALSDASQENTTPEVKERAKKTFQERNAAFVAELLLSTPDHSRPCPLLEVFRNQASEQEELMRSGGLIEKLVGEFKFVFRNGEVQTAKNSLLGRLTTLAEWTLRGMELRCATLHLVWHAMGEKAAAADIKSGIDSLITAYQVYFNTGCLREIPGNCDYRSAGLHRVDEIASQRGQNTDNKKNAAKAIVKAIEASQFAKFHRDPAVAFVCDTLALALGYPCGSTESLGKEWRPGDTWVLLGAKDSVASSGTGMVLRLRTEKVELASAPASTQEMCPAAFYPDPRLFAQLSVAECSIPELAAVAMRRTVSLERCRKPWS